MKRNRTVVTCGTLRLQPYPLCAWVWVCRSRTGEGVRGVTKRFGVDRSTVQRIARPFDGAAAWGRRHTNETKAPQAFAADAPPRKPHL